MRFLSDEWVEAMDAAARPVVVEARLVVERVVSDVPGTGEVRYHLVLDPHGSRVEAGPAEHPDLRLTTDYATAVALATGEINAQEALSRGRLRIGGDVHAFGRHGDALAAVEDVFASVRDATEYR